MVIDLRQAQEVVKQYFKQKIDNGKTTADGWDIVDMCAEIGGRGICVSEEWNEFIPFRDWALQNGYSDDLTIDRIDVNGNYEPSNCRWITMKEQHNNKRTNHKLEYKGAVHTISEWSEITGIGKTTIKERVNAGWSIEDVLTKPVRKRKSADMRKKVE